MSFPIIIDYSHIMSIITITHNTHYNLQLVFLELKWSIATNTSWLKWFLCDLIYIDLEAVSFLFCKITV